ncbi:hypothetical protein L3X38_041775 [Prunus dulcis]|uniref:Uncharacterized protein n=1 Tax=Prunus dulcis TaxID=3755 RepID=A0AAD4UVK0_PRUDU|nr:hypothetical protein L3X38_041775 [Prunus dulcis]
MGVYVSDLEPDLRDDRATNCSTHRNRNSRAALSIPSHSFAPANPLGSSSTPTVRRFLAAEVATGRVHCLVGQTSITTFLGDSEPMTKILAQEKQGFIAQLVALDNPIPLTTSSTALGPLLAKFTELFSVPTSLPPFRLLTRGGHSNRQTGNPSRTTPNQTGKKPS